ncbi:MAG: hypothetical protein JXR14_02480 [Paracoccaceae bacterium]
MAVSRSIVYALTANETKDLLALREIVVARLRDEERAKLALVMMTSLDADAAANISEQFMMGGQSWPLPVLDDLDGDAEFWASLATKRELLAYLEAILPHIAAEDLQETLADLGFSR